MKSFAIALIILLFGGSKVCAQNRVVAKVYYYTLDFALTGSNHVSNLDSSAVDFYIIIDLKVKEIQFVNAKSSIFDWITIIKTNSELSDEQGLFFTFDCKSKNDNDCHVSLDYSTLLNSDKFTLLITSEEANNQGTFYKSYYCKLK